MGKPWRKAQKFQPHTEYLFQATHHHGEKYFVKLAKVLKLLEKQQV